MKDIRIERPPGRSVDILALHQRLIARGLPVVGVSAAPGELVIHLPDDAAASIGQAVRQAAGSFADVVPVNRPMAVDLKQTIEHTREIRPLWQ